MADEQQNSQQFRDSDEYRVDEVHRRIVAREQLEPEEGFEKPPWWVWTVSVLVLFAMGFYMGKYGGSWSNTAHEVEQPSLAAAGAIKKVVKGDQVYIGVCQTCHQATGVGVPGQYPPLVGSEWLLRDAETPIRIVLYGLEGPITVKGSAYNNKMTPFHDKLSDDEIAAVLTHVRSSWSNEASPVTSEQVEAIRTQLGVRAPWSATELSALRTNQ
ncbi:MAG: cytochrome c [Ignavibacteriae bacterium]|nr:cytochrome c [Ignavibacteriota bacterium]